MKKFLAVFIVVSFYSSASYAQDVHLPGGLLSECDYCIASQGISPVAVGSTGGRYDFRYLRLQDMYEDGKKTDNPSKNIETYATHQISLYYHVSGDFSTTIFIPLSSRSASGLGEPPHDGLDSGSARYSSQMPQHHEGNEPYSYSVNGLSDIMLLGRYNVVNSTEETLYWTMTAGVKLPTGSTNSTDAMGVLLNPHNQLGTGSTDYLVGTDLVYGGGDYSAVLNLLSVFPTVGAQDYKFGNMLNYSLSFKYAVFDFGESSRIFAALSFDGELHAKEKHNGEYEENTGGNTAYISPAARFLLGEKISIDLSYHFPVIHNLYGMQLGETYRITAGAQYLF